MYVRWKRQRRRRGDDTQVAELVRSERVDGQPRQKVVRYLGSFRESDLRPKGEGHPSYRLNVLWFRRRFWGAVDAAFDGLDLSPEERGRAEERIAARIPRITGEERAELDADHAKSVVAASAILGRKAVAAL